MPNCDPRLYKRLDACGPTVWSKQSYERLASIAAGPLFEVLLAAGRPVDPLFVRYVERLAEADTAVQRLPPRLLADQTETESVIAVVALLRAHGLAVDRALAGLPQGAGLDAVVRRLRRLLNTLHAPPLPRPLPLGVRQIGTVAALRALGRSLDLCVKEALHGGADYWMRLVEGTSIFLILEDSVTLVELRRVGPDLWTLGDAKRASNRQPLPSTRRTLTASLTAAGWRLIDLDPVNALVTLAARTSEHFAECERDLGRLLRELESDWA